MSVDETLKDALKAARKARADLLKEVPKYDKLINHLESMLGGDEIDDRPSNRGCRSAVVEWLAGTDLEEFHAGLICEKLNNRFDSSTISGVLWSLKAEGQIEPTGQQVFFKMRGNRRRARYVLYRLVPNGG